MAASGCPIAGALALYLFRTNTYAGDTPQVVRRVLGKRLAPRRANIDRPQRLFPIDVKAGLCPNEKAIYLGRFFLVHASTDVDKTLQSHLVTSVHMNHFHRDPMVVNFGDFCKPDVDIRALAFQPESDSDKIPCNKLIRGRQLATGI